MDGNIYILSICDTCLNKLSEDNRIHYIADSFGYPDDEAVEKTKSFLTIKSRDRKFKKVD